MMSLRVLFLEDCQDDVELMLHQLRSAGFDVHWRREETEAAFLTQLAAAPDIVLSDYNMPQFDAPRALRLLRGLGLDIPFMVVSGSIGEDTAVQMLKDGADDYLLKDRLGRLGLAVRQALEQRRLRRAKVQAESQVRETEERFRILVQGVKDYAIYMLDQVGMVMTWNDGARAILGYEAEEILGKHYGCFFPPDDVAALKPERELELAAARGSLDEEGWRQRKDGSQFWSNGVLTALFHDDGVLRGFAKITRDLTERRKLEEQLRQAQKMEAVGQLAGGIAHDFNNLLTVISGYSHIVLSQLAERDAMRAFVREIQHASERASSLTRQLLAFSRKQVLEPQVLNPNALLRETEKMLKRLIGENIQLITKLDPDVNEIKVDPGQLVQVIMNLVVNAKDAMPTGGQVLIETKNTDLTAPHNAGPDEPNSKRYVLIAVSDTGCGMTEAVKPRVFEPFFTTKEIGKGTGLGLSVVHGIVKQSDGLIELTSEVGVGTAFKLFFPAVRRRGGSSHPGLAVPALGKETVLLVEDDDNVRSMALLSLQNYGYTVLEASNGKQALELAARHPGAIDLLITDVVLPEMNGRQIADSVRTVCPQTKILFMSGYTGDAILHHGIIEADAPFLQKPFTPIALARKTREVLDAAQQKRLTSGAT